MNGFNRTVGQVVNDDDVVTCLYKFDRRMRANVSGTTGQ
jgi:hypothetical protein